MACMPVEMHANRAGWFEQAFHFEQARIQPHQIARHAAFPNIREGAHFVPVAEDDVVIAPGEERRVNVDQVNALGWQLAHHVQVVAEEQAVGAGGE